MKALPSGRKLGNRKASFNAKKLWFAKYVNRSILKTTAIPPALDMSKSPLIAQNPFIMDSMLANGPSASNPPQIPNGVGDCFWAAAVRRAAIAAASEGKLLWTSEADMVKAALQGYASTGFDIDNPDATDQGTDPTQGFAFLSSTGLWCSDGTYDKQTIQLAVNPGDFDEVTLAFNVGAGNICIGVNFPSAWDSSNVWDSTTSPIEGGHEIPLYSDLKISPKGIMLDRGGRLEL